MLKSDILGYILIAFIIIICAYIYLDTDIIVKDDISKVFDVISEDVLYVLEEGNISKTNNDYGKILFGNEIDNYTDTSAFTSGILLFKNCEKCSKKYSFK